jgi:hypothetical protein
LFAFAHLRAHAAYFCALPLYITWLSSSATIATTHMIHHTYNFLLRCSNKAAD